MESAPRQPLGSKSSDHRGEPATQLVATVESLLPILDPESDGYESLDNCASIAEVSMVMPTAPAAACNNGMAGDLVLHTPITGETEAEKALKVSRKALKAEQARIAREKAPLRPGS